MATDFWSDEDRPASPPRPRWRWWQVTALVLLILLVLFGFAAALAPDKLAGGWHSWQVRQLRRDILNGNRSPEALRDELLNRDDGLYLACRLSEDADPRVRAASIDRLIARGTPARKQEPGEGWIDHVSTTLSEYAANEALVRLLDDPDPAVRKKAIRAASSVQENLAFVEKLRGLLHSGDTEERLIVCDCLAHWDGEQVLRTFADKQQSKEVRLAALSGTNRFGWARVVEDEMEFARVMKLVQADPDADIRRAATEALKHGRTERPK